MYSRIRNLKAKIHGGVLPAMATPILPNSTSVNRSAIGPLVDLLVDSGVKGLFVGGTTGEGILLSPGQRKLLHEGALAASADRVPVLLHVGSNTTAESVELARHASQIGAHGIVAVTPYFYPVHDDGILAHFQAIASAAPEIPFFGYDIPQMAINGISPALLQKMGANIPSFAGIKSSNPDAQMVRRLIDVAPEHSILLVGNERIALGSLALGADGLISGLSTAIPEPFVNLLDRFFTGQLEEAQYQQRLISRIIDLIPPGARIGAIKSLLEQRGIAVGPPLAPRAVPPPDWQAWEQIQSWID